MRHIKSYNQYNEGLKSTLAGIGLAGSLLSSNPSNAQFNIYDPSDHKNYTDPTRMLSPYSVYNNNKNKSDILYLPTSAKKNDDVKINDIKSVKKLDSTEIAKRMEILISMLNAEGKNYTKPHEDKKLDTILGSIKRAASDGGDSVKFKQLFEDLTNHMEQKYGYKLPNQKIENIDDQTILNLKDGMSKKDIFVLMGWIGSICLAICGLPQAWTSYKDKHSHGISWGFLSLWALGELFAMVYVYDKLDVPMILNYGTNILILAVIIYYKVKSGKNENEKD